jgi:hypothetical protein
MPDTVAVFIEVEAGSVIFNIPALSLVDVNASIPTPNRLLPVRETVTLIV